MEQCTSIYEKIQYALNDLPADFAHKEMYPIRKSIAEIDLDKEEFRTSAVLVLMFEENKRIKMVLTQRQEYAGKHSGQISFPGGKNEAYDIDFQDTALREANEEIGVSRENISIIGKLTDVFIPVSKFLVHPFIGYHSGVPTFQLSEREVKEVIIFDLLDLINDDVIKSMDISISEKQKLKNVPFFEINGKVVWGATALILNEIRHILQK